ncbi:hypothetical protein [Amycolatopsis sp. YIM 10]|uniref:hypothetical protein n=1 Tax=Amycolatopsis sp. YIM 10 TaxID=2653857 RepID=UPI0012906BDE|nr:hypothetical protein [Amycolatopsis sp. YIM 10]QFU88468.1 hypothetical protein YIM_16440 [Amycolatopsis sp. YIM 10]
MTETPEQRLHDALAGWVAKPENGPAELIDAACAALAVGLDSPALAELAGTSARDSTWGLRELAERALRELGTPLPGDIPPGYFAARGGGIARRPGTDSLRLAVVPTPDEARGFQVLVHVNGVEMTSAGAGLGMDPYALLIPFNRLTATAEPRTVPIARCGCGVYGCGSTDVTIVRDGDLVHWEWRLEVPMPRGVSFPAEQYDEEVARVAADHSWETPVRTAGRYVLTGLDHDRLRSYGLRADWVANDYRDPGVFCVALMLDDEYQVFLHTAWDGREPGDLAREVCAALALPPDQWSVGWHAIRPKQTEPPRIAGPSWRRDQRW